MILTHHQPPSDGNATPGYPTFLSQFVSTVRSAESALGVSSGDALSTAFMDVSWCVICSILQEKESFKSLLRRQWQNNKINPADVANGPATYVWLLEFFSVSES